jgi:DNA repair exonuclease SbcCD ATPase subunit
MQIQSISIKNFLSFGNTVETVNLEQSQSLIISGQVGAGKSSISEAISFALYGKTLRNLKKSEIPNKLNKKDCLVECNFLSRGHQYRVVRGISPNIFEIYKDGTLVNQNSTMLDYQQVLESEVIGYNFHLFKQLIVLNPVSYTSFFEMKTSARRELLEELLGLQEVGIMNQFLQGYISENRSQLTSATASSKEVSTSIKTIHSGITESKEKQLVNLESLNASLEQLRNRRELIQQKTHEVQNQIKDLNVTNAQSMIQDQQSLIGKIQSILTEMRTIVTRNNKEIEFINNHDECPTCYQKISSEHRETLTAQLDEVTTSTQQKIQAVNEKLKQVSSTKDSFDSVLLQHQQLESTLGQLETALKLIDKDIENTEQKLSATVDDSNIQFLQNELMNLATRLSDLQQQIATLTTQSQLYAAVREFLSDNGIRKVVVAKYVPYVVSRINFWLDRLNLFAKIKINEDFEEEIRLRGFDPTSYANLSSGEKAKVSLSLVFAFRELLALKTNSNINLLCFDEILENLDFQSKQDLFYTLRGVAARDNISILTVSHSVVSDFSAFDARLIVEKVGQFSKIKPGEL